MSATTVQFLVTRLIKADLRWSKAMARPGYRDDPDEADADGTPFTEQDWQMYGAADAWRCAVHALEIELFRIPHVRQVLLDAHSSGDDGVTFFVCEMQPNELALPLPELPVDPSKPPQTHKSGPRPTRPKPKRAKKTQS